MAQFEALSITCKDDYTLAARFYTADQNIRHSIPVLICPATGITKQFYHSFASWLSKQGFNVLVFDFRGIGESLHGALKKSRASIVQWGQLDIPAAVDTLLQKTHAEQIYLLGHSAGGQLLGIMPNHAKIAKTIAVSGSTGHVKHLSGRTKILAPLMFKGIFPIARYTLGYGPTRKPA